MISREPHIGITCDVYIPSGKAEAYELICDHRYAEAVKQAGGFPILLPIARRPNIIRRCLDGMDGLIIVGGDDVDPQLYGEKVKPGTGTVFAPRLAFECDLYRGARRRHIPILGICYGMQLINVLEGGSLHQDIRKDARTRENHRKKKNPTTMVRVQPRSRLRTILGTSRTRVHCEHHQAIARLAPGFQSVAHSPAGIVEAIEGREREILAVQWHPERTLQSPATKRLFGKFVKLCAARMRKS